MPSFLTLPYAISGGTRCFILTSCFRDLSARARLSSLNRSKLMLTFGDCQLGQDCPCESSESFVTEPPSWSDVLGLTLHPP